MYNKYFKQFIEDRNLKRSTIEGYCVSLKLYCDVNDKNLSELLSEALAEEKNYPLRSRSIRSRLLKFRNYLVRENKSSNTIKTYFSKVLTFYRHFNIEIPSLPKMNYPKSYELNYSDLPTKSDIARVLDAVPLDFKALILFMSSSGTAKAETLSLTVKDFIYACSEYYESSNLSGILNELSLRSDVVPLIYLRRVKTDKYYYTFCSSEASSFIVKYLKSRDDLCFDDMLFPFSSSLLTSKFQEVNDHLGWGKRGKYRFFRSHILRKFHASNIGLAAEYVDCLQGRQKSVVHDAYIKTNPVMLKELYVKNMRNVMIFNCPERVEERVVEEINVHINIFLSDMFISLD